MYIFLYLQLSIFMCRVRFRNLIERLKMKKSEKSIVQVYLTSKQKEQLKKLASSEGMTMTGYVVDFIRRESEKKK